MLFGLTKIKFYGVAALVAVSLMGATYGVGQRRGYNRGEAATIARYVEQQRKLQLELVRAGNELNAAVTELEKIKREREVLADELEQAARADPNGANECISLDGVQRLEQRWRTP